MASLNNTASRNNTSSSSNTASINNDFFNLDYLNLNTKNSPMEKLYKSGQPNKTEFLGAELIPLKESTIYTTTLPEDIALISGCMYFDANYLYDSTIKGTINYLLGFISTIETFNTKIQYYTTNPNKWLLRIYIDADLLNPDTFSKYSFTKITKNNIDHNNSIRKYVENAYDYDLINFFIYGLFFTYITKVLTSSDTKYNNVEIYSFNNENVKKHATTKSGNNIAISNHYESYGMLMRFHPLTDSRIGYCIIRNMSNPITILDLRFQNSWIERNETDYFAYKPARYRDIPKIISYYKSKFSDLYNFQGLTLPGGLISIKTTAKHDIFTFKLETVRTRIIDDAENPPEIKYNYGADEYILHFLIDGFQQSIAIVGLESYQAYNTKNNNVSHRVMKFFTNTYKNNNKRGNYLSHVSFKTMRSNHYKRAFKLLSSVPFYMDDGLTRYVHGEPIVNIDKIMLSTILNEIIWKTTLIVIIFFADRSGKLYSSDNTLAYMVKRYLKLTKRNNLNHLTPSIYDISTIPLLKSQQLETEFLYENLGKVIADVTPSSYKDIITQRNKLLGVILQSYSDDNFKPVIYNPTGIMMEITKNDIKTQILASTYLGL